MTAGQVLEQELIFLEDLFTEHAAKPVLLVALVVKSYFHQASFLAEFTYHRMFVLVKARGWIDSLLGQDWVIGFGFLIDGLLGMFSFFGISHLTGLLWFDIISVLIISNVRFFISTVVLIVSFVLVLNLFSLVWLLLENWE